MSGIVHGGWGYVIGAYVITVLVLGGYAVHAFALNQIGKRLDDYESR
jgi:hypothetical protein